MFLVFNKEKIYAYLISVLTVCFLLFLASTGKDTVETSSNLSKNIQNNVIQNNIANNGNTLNYR